MPKRSTKAIVEVLEGQLSHERDRRYGKLEQKLRDIEAKYKAAVKNIELMEEQTEFLNLLGEARDPEAWEQEIKKGTSHATAIACASDWHIEEPVDSKKVSGKNRFNLNIAEQRIHKFFEKIPVYVDRYVPMTKELILWLGGDFYSGHIHDDLIQTCALSPNNACLWWMERVNDGISFLRKEMPKLNLLIPCNDGNHGRITEKMRVSTRTENSLEWFTYKVMERDWHRRDAKVRFRVCDGYHLILEVHGRLIRFHHGDGINYQGGVGGLSIPTRKAIAQWNKANRVDLDVFGNWHGHEDGGIYFRNGSLIGYGAYSVKIKADYEPPMQGFLVFDKKFGLRQSTRIFVGDL